MIILKKYIFLIILFLTSCSNSNSDNKIELKNPTTVYAYNVKNKKIEEVNIKYEIEDVKDVFDLYTKYQNILPLGYVAMSSCNVELLEYKISDNTCYYYVDNYISLVDDIEIFSNLLSSTNCLLGYAETKIIYNDNIIA